MTTNEAATCRWGTATGVAYASMANAFSTSGDTAHSTTLTGLADGQSYERFVRCQDGAGNATAADYPVSFSVGTGPGPLSLALVASRASGVAPLSVLFDASGTTDTLVTQRPFHDLEYRWDFGDPAGSTVSGTAWTVGSGAGVNSRNAATGPLAAHVFERPGTYTVALSVFDGTNRGTMTTIITVTDPDAVFSGTNTICFSTAAAYTGCPAGASNVQTSNFATAVNNNMATNRRLLFHRGETFTAPSTAVIDANGPGIIGAYGTGAKPLIHRTGGTEVIQPATSSTPAIGDWRIMDLAIDGMSTIEGSNVGISAGGEFGQLLILRVGINRAFRGVAANHWILSAGEDYRGWAVVDSTMTGIPGCNSPGNYRCDWRIYLAGSAHSIQGNSLDNEDTGGSHVVRSEHLTKSVIANNVIARAGGFQLAIKIHGWAWQGGAGGNSVPGTYSEKIIIADNKIVGGINPWTVSLGPQDQNSDERVRDVIIERNWFVAGSSTQLHLHVNSSQTTIRNNIMDMSGALYHQFVDVGRWGVEPVPTNVHVFGNTFYSGSSGDFIGVGIDSVSVGAVVENNLGSAPLASGPIMTDGTGASGFLQSNNLLHNSPAALFVSASPAVPADFRLRALPNPARNTGLATVPLFTDFFGASRTQSGPPDIGAAEGL